MEIIVELRDDEILIEARKPGGYADQIAENFDVGDLSVGYLLDYPGGSPRPALLRLTNQEAIDWLASMGATVKIVPV